MKRPLTWALAAAAAIAAPAAAEATVTITSISGQPGFLSGSISYAPASLNLSVGVGRLRLVGTESPSGDAIDLLTYCVDIFHYVHTGAFEFAPVSTVIANPAKRAQLLALLGNAEPLIAAAPTLTAKKNISAAIQLAVWDITYESGLGGYSLSSGDFRASGGTIGSALTLAGTYLNNVTSGAWTPVSGSGLGLLYAPSNQSQLFLTAVPEPATWAMMIGGFGLAGAALRRRKSRKIALAVG